jgi:predicted enzyme related to lactoylglutathione lyase
MGQRHRRHGGPRARGNGVLLWFQVEDFDADVERARASSTEILEGPKVNPNTHHREIWLRDPDGYVVVLASAGGDVEKGQFDVRGPPAYIFLTTATS